MYYFVLELSVEQILEKSIILDRYLSGYHLYLVCYLKKKRVCYLFILRIYAFRAVHTILSVWSYLFYCSARLSVQQR